ncbi:MAG: hypothetical protein WKF73_00425 [Nocardioidaceae bacterium]
MRVHLNRGNVHLQQGRATSALADFEAAARFASVAELPVQHAKAEYNLGYTNLLRGDLVTALRLMDKASLELDCLSPFNRAVGQLDKAEVLVASGMIDEAAESLRQAAQAFGSLKVSPVPGGGRARVGAPAAGHGPGRVKTGARLALAGASRHAAAPSGRCGPRRSACPPRRSPALGRKRESRVRTSLAKTCARTDSHGRRWRSRSEPRKV